VAAEVRTVVEPTACGHGTSSHARTARRTDAHYDRTALWWGTTRISDRDRARARLVHETAGGASRVLELGVGFGGTAAATADLGHHVFGIERSHNRAAWARRHMTCSRAGRLEILEADFDTVTLSETFDGITYWSGFGAGPDSSHRALLQRMRGWLRPAGWVLIDVFEPTWWAAQDGTVQIKRGFTQRLNYDLNTSRLCVTYWLSDRPQRPTTETIRCYTPEEFADLVDGIGFVCDPGRPTDVGSQVSFLVEMRAT
jgi:SAM-dependent methyltransferase